MGACVQCGSKKGTENGGKRRQQRGKTAPRRREEKDEVEEACNTMEFAYETKELRWLRGEGGKRGNAGAAGERGRRGERERETGERARWWARTASDQNALVGRELGGRGRRRDERWPSDLCRASPR